jgi:large subunit ribosomal protein L17
MRIRKLGRATDHRMAMLRNLVTFLFENGKIKTTLQKAREVSVLAEKYISKAKIDSLHNKRQVFSFLKKDLVTRKLFGEIAPRFLERNGGYTRIVKLGPRRGDAGEMAIIELIKE